MVQITQADIVEFSEKYQKENKNKQIEREITKLGLEKACLDKKVIEENPCTFNLELCETKRYDQKDSLKCWIFAGINMIKRNMAKNLNSNDLDFALSNSYIAFFDKLEKSNNLYEKVIHAKTNEIDKWKNNLENCVTECGNYMTFISTLEKYGIVPLLIMPDSKESEDAEKITLLYREKVKKDIFDLFEMKKKDKSREELRRKKQQYIRENYMFLSKILGEPPLYFNYSYQNKEGKKITLRNITPLEFKERFLTLRMKDYVYLENCEGWEYNQKRTDITVTNVYKKSSSKLINVSIERLKEVTIAQLKEGIPVYMGINMLRDRNLVEGILDTRFILL